MVAETQEAEEYGRQAQHVFAARQIEAVVKGDGGRRRAAPMSTTATRVGGSSFKCLCPVQNHMNSPDTRGAARGRSQQPEPSRILLPPTLPVQIRKPFQSATRPAVCG